MQEDSPVGAAVIAVMGAAHTPLDHSDLQHALSIPPR